VSRLLAAIDAGDKPMIGMIALAPLPGSSRYDGRSIDDAVRAATAEAAILVGAGFDAVMVQNLGDLPVAQRAAPAQIAWMTRLVAAVASSCEVPIGLNLLENDAEAMLAVVSATDADFVRIKVFTGAVLTPSGIEHGQAFEAMRARTSWKLDVALLADVHDRTGIPLATAGLADDLRTTFAIGGADGVVLTGRTRAETVEYLSIARSTVPGRPLIIGGGVNAGNVAELLELADAAIVSSALKSNDTMFGTLDADKARAFMHAVRAARSRAGGVRP
jgi:membrane complex biogenesis BtpA family protein